MNDPNKYPYIRPVVYLVRKEFRQIFRQRPMLVIIFVLPLIQLLIFAHALTTDLKYVRLVVLDQCHSPASRDLVRAFVSSDYFRISETAASPAVIEDALLTGRGDVALFIPPDYAENLQRGRPATVGLTVDGSNSSIGGRALGYAEAVVRGEATRLLEQRADAQPLIAQRVHLIEPEVRYYYNPELVSKWFMVPGIVVLILTIVSAMLSGMAIVREKEIGTLEQLLVSPLTPLQLIAGKLIPFIILAYFELGIATTAAVVFFKLPLTGSLPLLAFCAFVYLMVTLGIGLLASTVSSTQQQAMFTIWFFLIFAILMSGFFFPVENMPKWVYKLTYLNPLRYMMSIVRGIFLKGSTLQDVLPDLLPLGAIGIVIFMTAVMRFGKKMG